MREWKIGLLGALKHLSWTKKFGKLSWQGQFFLTNLGKIGLTKNVMLTKKQQKLCVKFLKAAKENFWNNLDVKEITDHKFFWKTVKPNFSGKTLKDEIITLVKVGKTILEESELAKCFYNYFESFVEGLDLKIQQSSWKCNQNYPSIEKIKSSISLTQTFSFAFCEQWCHFIENCQTKCT